MRRGTVVMALAGREKGRLLAVTAADEKFVYICDGKERPLERPKRKSLRHVRSAGRLLPEEGMSTNRQLRRSLKETGGLMTDG